jgi:hypothetical protein
MVVVVVVDKMAPHPYIHFDILKNAKIDPP